MYGGPSSKLGRAAPKRLRSSFPPLPSHRPPSSANSSLSGNAQKTPPTVEETSSLVSGSNPLPFSMIIKLTPDLVEAIKRVEAQGGIARMKYDPNPNNSNGNIIDVGGKEFRFTWSRDGDLCDIYEQHQSGVDGNGLLVESGCAWRKVNVQRILDESAKNHVKMRSKEAERMLKSRKAIVLEPENLSMKSQMAAVEATSGKNCNKKKYTAFNKRIVETLQVGGPQKTSHKSGLMSTSIIAKGKHSSLLPSSTHHFAPSSPQGAVKNIPVRYFLKPWVDSKSFKKPLTESGSLPEENHNQAPSHEEFHNQTSAPQGGFEEKTPNDDLVETMQVKSKVEEESNPLEKVELRHASPDIFGDKKGSDYSEGRAGSSNVSDSDSDSDSDSESNSSDSESHSRSRGRSPTGSGSGSSSESDVSSSSMEGLEGSDEDVDIMSDDEKEPTHKGETCDQRISLPIPVTSSVGRSMQNEAVEKQDGNEFDAVDIEKDSPEEHEARMVLTTDNVFDKVRKYAEETEPFSPEYQQLQERKNYLGSLIDENEGKFKDSSRNEQSDSPYRLSKGKHKRGSELNNIDEKSEGTKRLKAGNLTHDSNSLATDVKMLGNSRADRQGNSSLGFQKRYNRTLPGKSVLDLPQTVQRDFDQSPQGKTSYPLEKSDKLGESTRHNRKHSGKDFHACEVSHVQEDRANTSEDMSSTITKAKASLKATIDSGKPSLVFVSSGLLRNLENTNKKNVDYHLKDSTKSLSRVTQTHSQHLNGDNASIGSQNKLTEMNTKFRNNESRVSHDIKLDGHSDSNRRVPANGSKQDTQSGMISYPVKESKRQTPNSCEEVADVRKDSVFADRNNSDQKMRDSSSEEISCCYLKYEKEEPELKGPITSISQYEECVLEYREKYESYVSLNKILQNYSNEFQKLADDLEHAKTKGDMDRYYHIVEQINESFGQCGLRHKRLKKIFVVLHEELADIKQKTLKTHVPLLIHSMPG